MIDAAIPERLETERLRLRPFTADDWPAMHEHYADPECVRFTYRKPLGEIESWMALAALIGHWSLRGYGPYALEEKAGSTVVGTVGLWYPEGWPEPEIKWALSRRHWGRGYASEAVRAVQRMAATHLPDLPLISFIDRNNAASIALALAVGARLEREVSFRGHPWHIYRHPGRTAA